MLIAQITGADYNLLLTAAIVGVITSLSGLIAALTSIFMAHAAKIRSDIAGVESARARELTRQNAEKLDRVEVQTNSHLTAAAEMNKHLREELAAVQHELSVLMGRMLERKAMADSLPKPVAFEEPPGEKTVRKVRES